MANVSFHVLAICCSLLLTLASTAFATTADSLNVSRGYSYDGLTVFLVHGVARSSHNYLTLQEALQQGLAIIHERNSQTLWVDNLSDRDLFVQSSDLIKGGQQDRMIANDMIVAPHTKSVELKVFCIEHDRSYKRGAEPLEYFSSSNEMAPIHHLRITANTDLTSQLLTPRLGGVTAPDPSQLELLQTLSTNPQFNVLDDAVQESIWQDVRNVQSALTRSVKDSVTRNVSPSSLELALEHPRVRSRVEQLSSKLSDIVHSDAHATGVVFARNGKITGADIYETHDLFEKMWPKLLEAGVNELLIDSPQTDAREVTRNDVLGYLEETSTGRSGSISPNERTLIMASQSERIYNFETRDIGADSSVVHRALISK